MVKGSEASVRLDSVGVEFDDERLIAMRAQRRGAWQQVLGDVYLE
jgi:hypothetical protein